MKEKWKCLQWVNHNIHNKAKKEWMLWEVKVGETQIEDWFVSLCISNFSSKSVSETTTTTPPIRQGRDTISKELNFVSVFVFLWYFVHLSVIFKTKKDFFKSKAKKQCSMEIFFLNCWITSSRSRFRLPFTTKTKRTYQTTTHKKIFWVDFVIKRHFSVCDCDCDCDLVYE
jgi:hypothetical protein